MTNANSNTVWDPQLLATVGKDTLTNLGEVRSVLDQIRTATDEATAPGVGAYDGKTAVAIRRKVDELYEVANTAAQTATDKATGISDLAKFTVSFDDEGAGTFDAVPSS